MAKIYIHNAPRKGLSRFAKRLIFLGIFLAMLLGGESIFFNYYRSNESSHTVTKAEFTEVKDANQTITSPYFSFQDTTKWALNTTDSTSQKFVYDNYRGVLLQRQFIVYVNQTPSSLYLVNNRVLPVRIVNGNSFDVTSVSDSCGKTYASGELHRVKEVMINGATMLCDPDNSQYGVELALIGGNYSIPLRTSNGNNANFVILYHDSTLAPSPETLMRIVSSFKAL